MEIQYVVVQILMYINLSAFHCIGCTATMWVGYQDEYLDKCMALEAKGRWGKCCAGCRNPVLQYQCKDCTHRSLWCKDCLLVTHH